MRKIVISTIVAASLLLVGCGKKDSKDTVKEFMSSVNDADYEKAKELTIDKATLELMELASFCHFDKTKEYFQDALKVLSKSSSIFTNEKAYKAKRELLEESKKENFTKKFNNAKTLSEYNKVYDDYLELIKKHMEKLLEDLIKKKNIKLKHPEITKNTIYRYLAYKNIHFGFQKFSKDTRGLQQALLEELDKNGKLSLTEECVKKYTNLNEDTKLDIYTGTTKDKEVKVIEFPYKGHSLNDLFN
jgi:major membrane immunogen (membrane-anchored lipoprotein)